MKAAIIPNYEKNGVEVILSRLLSELDRLKIEYFIIENADNLPPCDFVIAIGGDGTIIHAAKSCAVVNKAVLGINAGRLGYLANMNPDELSLLGTAVGGNYFTDERMMLDVVLNGFTYKCLNDAVISKGSLSRMIDISAEVDDNNISYRSDGLIAATPTGSTAYSMSAGGPIIDPELDVIVLTPICSHSLSDRSVVISGNSVIKVRTVCPSNAEAFLTIDGEKSVKLSSDDIITVSRAKETAKLIKLKNNSFYKTLSEKLRG